MKDFGIRGGYTHGATSGVFSGALRIYDDNRMVGTMIDSGKDIRFNKGKTKLIIGIKDENEMQLNFWKFSPSEITVPLLYVLRHDAGLTGDRYEGRWVPIEVSLKSIIKGVEEYGSIPELEEAFKATTLEKTLEILGRIQKNRIEPYLDSNLIGDILAFGPEKGYLNLNQVDSFSN